MVVAPFDSAPGHRMHHAILLDVESRSRANLKAIGGRLYWEHPSSEVLCVVWYDTRSSRVGDVVRDAEIRNYRLYCPRLGAYDIPPPPSDAVPYAAHNMTGFDRYALAQLGWMSLDERGYYDTSELARRAGLPGSLDELGSRLLDLPKDKEGSKLTKSLSSVRRPTKEGRIEPAEWSKLSAAAKRERGVLPDVDAKLPRVVEYCQSDVEIMARTWAELQEWIGIGDEEALVQVDRAMMDRGIQYDTDLARALLKADERNTRKTIAAIAAELDTPPDELRAAANSPEQFTALTGAPNAQADTVAELVKQGGIAGKLATVRQALATIARGKLTTALVRTGTDGRMRDSTRYLAAHTWRWGGVGFQPQNLPRPEGQYEEWTDGQIHELALRVIRTDQATPAEIELLLRATLCAAEGHRLVVADFSGVESRALAWCAGDYKALRVIEVGTDPYKVEASAIYGVPIDEITKPQRQAGKISVLACGYGGGPNAINKMAAQMHIDLAAAGTTAREVVDAWRRNHAPCVRFWRQMEDGFRAAWRGRVTEVDVFTFERDGEHVNMWLPSGRPIVYRDVEFHAGRFGPQITFRGQKTKAFVKGWQAGREPTYGGKLTENAIQALCRDLMADCLVRAEAAELRPVLTVHDEIVCEMHERIASQTFDALIEIMSTPPEWADTFPLASAGFVGRRYRK